MTAIKSEFRKTESEDILVPFNQSSGNFQKKMSASQIFS